jgi:adenine-specific DNA-methyltransferase
MMERRLLLAKYLLDPDDSVLIVTIDEKEYLRLGLLLEQTFPEATIQMASVVTNPSGSVRPGRLARTDEYWFFAYFGAGGLTPQYVDGIGKSAAGPLPKVWETAIRSGTGTGIRASRPNLFYPVFVDSETIRYHSVGDPLPISSKRAEVTPPAGTTPIWPLAEGDREQTWGFASDQMRIRLQEGTARIARGKRGPSVLYMQSGVLKKIEQGTFKVVGRQADGSLELAWGDGVAGRPEYPRSVWTSASHSASSGGTRFLQPMLPGRSFPYPKSLYAVEDALRYVVANKPEALVLDFFSGSGTTAHAVMRLNRQDGGRRRSISITNNEVGADEQAKLREQGLRAGDPDWERWGICDYITKPRIRAAIEGRTPEGQPIKGDYKFTDVFPMSDGFDENVEFFTLTYEAPIRVQSNREFAQIAPFLWLRAGSSGRRIDSITNGWDVADAYGVLEDLDRTEQFLAAMRATPAARIAYIITDEDRLFEAVVRDLPTGVEPVRLYQAYLSNFEIDAMRSVR